MESHGTSGRLPLLSKQRPAWQRILIWIVIAFLAINVLSVALIAFSNMQGSSGGQLILTVVAALVLSIPFGGLNLVRTGANKAIAEFKRREDRVQGGYVYEVRPARASWLAVLVPLPIIALLAVVWAPFPALVLWLLLSAIFVLPGARHRKRAKISVSPLGVASGEVSVPLARIADLEVGNNGVAVSREPLVARPGGIPTSTLVGRGLGNRQRGRSFTLSLRADGDSRAHVIAGGLTEECADYLERDIRKAIESLRAGAATAAAAGA